MEKLRIKRYKVGIKMAYALTNGTIYTCNSTDEVIEAGTIIVRQGKIHKIIAKSDAIPSDAEIIDVKGKCIVPGFVNSHTHEGIFDGTVGEMGVDGNEASFPTTPMIRVIDAINIEGPAFMENTKGGVTTINTGPGSANVVGGQFALVKTYAKSKQVEDYILKAPSAMKAALGENCKFNFTPNRAKTRMGIAAIFRKVFVEAQTYGRKWEEYSKKKQEAEEKNELDKIPARPDLDDDKELLLKVLRKEIPIHIHCHQHNDIVTAIRLAEEFNLDLMIVHGTEGHKIAEFIASKNIPVSVGPSLVGFHKSELRDITFDTPNILHKAGVKISIQSDMVPRPIYFQLLPCMAVKYGLPVTAALRAVTIDAAEMCGVGDRIGSIEEGKDADLVVWSAHPVKNFYAENLLTMVDGNIAYRKE